MRNASQESGDALCEWDSFFDFNSQILIRSKFGYFYFLYLQFILCNFLILFLLEILILI